MANEIQLIKLMTIGSETVLLASLECMQSSAPQCMIARLSVLVPQPVQQRVR